MYAHLNKLSDTAILSLERFYSNVLRQPWGYKKFPNAGMALMQLRDIIEQRIPADHIEQIQKLHLYINSKP